MPTKAKGNIVTIEKRNLSKRIGTLSDRDLTAVENATKDILGL